ncbi:MAG: glutamate--tRNA ligase [Nitrospiraceae bacterium]|nr:MAG: glutamate--tRNA ligase [Nitrospiraceae bacterium]
MSRVRVRFAPSPTGYLHIGGVRTALFNWLFARHENGRFILRIEDTDRERSTPEAIQAILDGMKWVGLDWDEGPLYQTDRLAIYKEQADRLLAEGKAYLCYCTEEELEARRKEALARKELPKYDGRCRRRSGAAPAGVSPATRFVSPQDGQTTVHDLIKGDVTFDNAQLDDLVIVRSNGMPTYNFGVVVDDARMAITHVIRGDDHLNNTPRQILLYQALGYEPPQFGHLSMILGMDKVKLSKRHGATSVLEYQEAGYLPEALVNYLVRLGWSHGDQEVFSSQEMIEKFSLENITRSPAAFNPEKLLWLNGHYLKTADTTRVAELLLPFLRKRGVLDGGAQPDSVWLGKLVGALRERSQTLVEMADKAAPFFQESVMMDQDAAKKFLTVAVQPAFARLVAVLDQTSVFEHDALEQGFKSVLAETGLSMGKLAQPVRVALTGGTVSPGIFDVMALLGRERTLARLKKAIDLMC